MRTILVVDDSVVSRCLVAGLLIRDGQTRVILAENGKNALEILARAESEGELPDIVLTDLAMPELDGLGLIDAIGQRHPEVPVIILTGCDDGGLAGEALRRGAASYVPKAQQSERLLSTVEQVLARVAAERHRQRLLGCIRELHCKFILESDPELVRPLVDFAQNAMGAVGLGDTVVRTRVAIALEEAMLNAIYHGAVTCRKRELTLTGTLTNDNSQQVIAPGPSGTATQPAQISVSLHVNSFEARAVIRDSGNGFDPVVASSGDAADRFGRGRNRGLCLIRSFTDEALYSDDGTEVTLLKRRTWRPHLRNRK